MAAQLSASPGSRDQDRVAPHDFTLLMAVYADDDETNVRSAYLSATAHQTLPPTAVVIVRDGPVTAGVAGWLDEISADPGVTVVALETNQGLARALNEGLAHIHTDLVARADADDICLPTRFARQIPLISSGLDVVGSAISEFSKDPRRPGPVRTVATTQ
ncbi:MAG: glycosyltransferase, partial [Propionibacteriaceae bacterium]|nr:glycosyltransferase [Propionibacteriaceae bacterium]